MLDIESRANDAAVASTYNRSKHVADVIEELQGNPEDVKFDDSDGQPGDRACGWQKVQNDLTNDVLDAHEYRGRGPRDHDHQLILANKGKKITPLSIFCGQDQSSLGIIDAPSYSEHHYASLNPLTNPPFAGVQYGGDSYIG